LACLCNSGFIWDVMTLLCIPSSSCLTVSASCMKCPTGIATTLVSANARNLYLGILVQGEINGTSTNYNQIKKYQCPCSSGYSWDSQRLRCFTTGLL
jgi:hypothetical protein